MTADTRPAHTRGLTEEDRTRLIGVRDGYVRAIVKIKRAIIFGTEYPPIAPRHVRKIKAQEDRLRIAREVVEQLEDDLTRIRDAITTTGRVALSKATGSAIEGGDAPAPPAKGGE